MFFDLGAENVILEQYAGNQMVSQQNIAMPREFLMIQFMQLCQEAAQSHQPFRLVMRRYQEIWNDFENEPRNVEFRIEFKNNRWEE